MSDLDIDALIRGRRSPRRRLLGVGAVVVIAAAAAIAFIVVRGEGPEVVIEPERDRAVTGQLSTTVDLSGSAAAERSATLSFDTAGVVAWLAVTEGDRVGAGDALATLDDSDARRRVETAEVQLRLAQLRLDDLLADPGASDIAAASQSIESAEAQLLGAEQALERLTEPATASDLASAEQAVANALGQLSAAEQALATLTEEPNAGDLASAEQAVANALGQLSAAEQALATLTEEPSEAELAAARSAITQARAQLTSANNQGDQSWDALGEAFGDYCDRYTYLPGVETTCAATLPLSDDQIADLRDSLDGRSSTYGRYVNTLIGASVAFVTADAARESAVTALGSAEERLAGLLTPVSADDRYQAEQAIEAARANHAAQVARLADLEADPEEDDVYQAEQAVAAARANHAAAAARLDDLGSPADRGELDQARSSLESARAALLTAQARSEELSAGPTANAIAQQEQNLRLAEISLEEARADLLALTVFAPFDGVVEAVSVEPGDRVTANFAAFSLGTPDRVLIELTVTEADLLDLAVGQAGLASFDAIEDIEYPVRIASISRLPNAAQGVVTYDVEARILEGAELAALARELTALGGLAAGLDAAVGGAGRAGAAGLGGLAGRAGLAGGALAGFELPEGVTIRQVLEALANGDPLPEGVELPEGLEIPPEALQRIAGILAGGGGAEGAARPEGAGAARPLPAPGMSASVTILTELRSESVLVPVSAVRQLDGGWFVTVPGSGEPNAALFRRLTVEVGVSDGVQVEITSGLEAGSVLLVGADSAGIAFSATQQQLPQPALAPGFRPGGAAGGGAAGGRP